MYNSQELRRVGYSNMQTGHRLCQTINAFIDLPSLKDLLDDCDYFCLATV